MRKESQSLSENFMLQDINIKQTSKAPKPNQADADLNLHHPPEKLLPLIISRGLRPHFDKAMKTEINAKKDGFQK